jgi:hypothetical protein
MTIEELIDEFLKEDIVLYCPTKESFEKATNELKSRNIQLADICLKYNWDKYKDNTCMIYMSNDKDCFIEDVRVFKSEATLNFDKYINGMNISEDTITQLNPLIDKVFEKVDKLTGGKMFSSPFNKDEDIIELESLHNQIEKLLSKNV